MCGERKEGDELGKSKRGDTRSIEGRAMAG